MARPAPARTRSPAVRTTREASATTSADAEDISAANGVVGVGERTVPSGLAALVVAMVPLWLLGMDAALNHVAFSAYGIAVRALPTATVATYAYVNPVIAVLLGALILGERLTPAMIGGGVLIVGAVILVVRCSPPAR